MKRVKKKSGILNNTFLKIR